MAQAAEEYGSHNKTFEIEADGQVQVIDAAGNVLMQHNVEAGDIWRMCQTKDAPVKDWVQLAVNRARLSNTPAVFWLDENRPHDKSLLAKVKAYLAELDTDGLDIRVLAPEEAAKFSLGRLKNGGRHHLRNRQRPARLPDRLVPNFGTGYQRENAVYRSIDERRRYV